MSWKLVFTTHAKRDAKKIGEAGLKSRTSELLNLLSNDPFKSPPSFEKLVGDLTGAYSRRINIKHRLVYQILVEEKVVKILRMWSHYE